MIQAPAFIKQLNQGLFKVPSALLMYGEEPLQLREALDALRVQLKTQGYEQRETFEVDGNFDWQALTMEANAGSLFAENRIIELLLPTGKPGKKGSEFIVDWFKRPVQSPPEIVLVILCEKIEQAQVKSKWFQAIEANGLAVQSRPIALNALPQWCQNRAREMGLQLSSEAAQVLAERVEGNLLAADQELEKLSLLFPSEHPISETDIQENVADQAHYQLFALSTAALTGQTAYALQILNRLRQEGLEAAIILWLLAKEVRTLVQVLEYEQTQTRAQAFKQCRVWAAKQNELGQALRRQGLSYWRQVLADCAQADFEIKGLQKGDIWLTLNQILVKISAV